MKLFAEETENKERPWTQKSKVLARVEDQFVNFFLQSVGPTTASEMKRSAIFQKVKQLIESSYEEKGKLYFYTKILSFSSCNKVWL